MGASVPKQFLELDGKAILHRTVGKFTDAIPGIKVITVLPGQYIQSWKDYCSLRSFFCRQRIVEGGFTRFHSVKNGLEAVPDGALVAIHDGVRPLLNTQLISDNIQSVCEFGSAVTVTPAIETVIYVDPSNGDVTDVLDRSVCRMAKAPQSFILSELMEAHEKARREGKKDFIDSATLMKHYGHAIHTVPGPVENIKITTPLDYYLFRAIMDARENAQIMGI